MYLQVHLKFSGVIVGYLGLWRHIGPIIIFLLCDIQEQNKSNSFKTFSSSHFLPKLGNKKRRWHHCLFSDHVHRAENRLIQTILTLPLGVSTASHRWGGEGVPPAARCPAASPPPPKQPLSIVQNGPKMSRTPLSCSLVLSEPYFWFLIQNGVKE